MIKDPIARGTCLSYQSWIKTYTIQRSPICWQRYIGNTCKCWQKICKVYKIVVNSSALHGSRPINKHWYMCSVFVVFLPATIHRVTVKNRNNVLLCTIISRNKNDDCLLRNAEIFYFADNFSYKFICICNHRRKKACIVFVHMIPG